MQETKTKEKTANKFPKGYNELLDMKLTTSDLTAIRKMLKVKKKKEETESQISKIYAQLSKLQNSELTIKEARRYIANAQKILQETDKIDIADTLSQTALCRKASHTALVGVLIAIASLMKKKKCVIPTLPRKNIEKFRDFLREQDLNVLSLFDDIYSRLHFHDQFEDAPSSLIVTNNLLDANELIDWCEKQGAE